MPVVVMYIRSALPCSTTLVSPPTMRDARIPRGLRHGANFSFENRSRKASFENVGDDQSLGPRAGNCKIVHRAVDCEFSDGAPGKTSAA